MKKYTFDFGGGAVAHFEMKSNALVLTVNKDGETYGLRFLDSVTFDTPSYLRNENEYTLDTFTEKTAFTENENTLTAKTEMDKGLTVYNEFTMDKATAKIIIKTYFESCGLLYDTSATVGKFETDISGFSETFGGEIPATFPVKSTAPHFGFKERLVLSGKGRYMEVHGGMVGRVGGVIESHLSSNFFNDNIAYFSKSNPIETLIAFEIVEKDNYAQKKTQAENAECLVSGNISVAYRKKTDGVCFVSLNEERPIVAMSVENIKTGERLYLDTVCGWKDVNVNKSGKITEFLLLDNERCDSGVGVKITASTERKNRIEWKCEAINESENYTVLWCSYPRFYFETDGIYDLLTPYHGGCVERAFNKCDGFCAGGYPSGLSITTQYFALYNERGSGGIYYGIHDPTGGYKDFVVSSSSTGGEVLFKTTYCAEGIGEAKNGFVLPGKACWESFVGDWFDATEIYREFVEAECDFAKFGLNGRPDIPEWFLDMPFWIMDWVPMEEGSNEKIPDNLRPKEGEESGDGWYKTPIKLRRELGVPIGYHIYNWHKIPFNNDYPHYFPTKPCVPEGLSELKRADIKVMPYINALMWDKLDRENTDWQYTKIAKPSAVKKSNGEVKGIPYGQFEKDGTPTLLSPMCPTSLMWRDKVGEIVKTLFYEYGFDGVYLDQISAHIPHPCMDKTHSHRAGGGNWWQKSFRDILKHLNSIKPKDGILTSESNAEVYSADLDGLLSWSWIRAEKSLPAFMRIYGGKTVVFGRNAGGYMKDDTLHWKYNMAEGFLAGEQMGWVNSDFVNDPDRLEFIKRLVRFRYENRIFFRRCRPMRTPRLDAREENKFTSGIGMNCQGVIYTSYLRVGALENGEDKMFLAVNLKDEAVTERVKFHKIDLPEEFVMEGVGSYERDGDTLTLTVPSGELFVLKWKGKIK